MTLPRYVVPVVPHFRQNAAIVILVPQAYSLGNSSCHPSITPIDQPFRRRLIGGGPCLSIIFDIFRETGVYVQWSRPTNQLSLLWKLPLPDIESRHSFLQEKESCVIELEFDIGCDEPCLAPQFHPTPYSTHRMRILFGLPLSIQKRYFRALRHSTMRLF